MLILIDVLVPNEVPCALALQVNKVSVGVEPRTLELSHTLIRTSRCPCSFREIRRHSNCKGHADEEH